MESLVGANSGARYLTTEAEMAAFRVISDPHEQERLSALMKLTFSPL